MLMETYAYGDREAPISVCLFLNARAWLKLAREIRINRGLEFGKWEAPSVADDGRISCQTSSPAVDTSDEFMPTNAIIITVLNNNLELKIVNRFK